MERQRPAEVDAERIDADEARDLLATDDVAALGRRADARRRRLHGDRVHYGGAPDDGIAGGRDGLVELDAREEDVVPGPDDLPAEVDAVVAGVGIAPERHEALHDAGVATDAAVRYRGDGGSAGDEGQGFVAELEECAAIASRTGGLRCVDCVPADERSTAYDDLRAVAVARLVLDGDVHVRIRRPAVGDKLAQTALAYGVDDVGFAGEGDFDTELVIGETGDEPRLRGPEYHG